MHRLLNTGEASEFLEQEFGVKRSPGTLAKGRVVGGCNPPYRKFGRAVLYDPNDLSRWVAETLSAPRHSTSDSAAIASIEAGAVMPSVILRKLASAGTGATDRELRRIPPNTRRRRSGTTERSPPPMER